MTHDFVSWVGPGCGHAGQKCGKTSPGPHSDVDWRGLLEKSLPYVRAEVFGNSLDQCVEAANLALEIDEALGEPGGER